MDCVITYSRTKSKVQIVLSFRARFVARTQSTNNSNDKPNNAKHGEREDKRSARARACATRTCTAHPPTCSTQFHSTRKSTMALVTTTARRAAQRTSTRAAATHLPLSASRRDENENKRSSSSLQQQQTLMMMATLMTTTNTTAIRAFHSTPQRDSAILVAGLGVAATAMGAKYVIQVRCARVSVSMSVCAPTHSERACCALDWAAARS